MITTCVHCGTEHDDERCEIEEARIALVIFGKEVIRPMPEPRPGPPDLLGFDGPVGFVCSTCSGKIVERGIALKQFGDQPVWKTELNEPQRTCALCNRKV